MASSKTLAPTNVTISIPAMTDVPDASVFSNCVDKEADAINSLNSKLTNTNYVQSGVTIPLTTIATGSFATLATFTPAEAGTYMIEADAGFEAGSGIRILLVDTTDTTTNTPANSVLSEGRASLQKVRYFTLSTSDTVYIKAYQNSGSNMSVNGYYRIMRMK